MNKPLQPDMEHRHEKYEKGYHQCAARRDQENSMTESRGAMTAQQFMETGWMVIKPWPASLIVTVADWLIFADDLSAHNTAQLTQELGALKKDCAIVAEADGEVINRQKAELERLRSQGAQRSQCAPIGTGVKTWADYRKGCLDTYGGGHRDDGHLEAFQHGMETVFNLLEAEFPPAEVCKSARSQGAGPWQCAAEKFKNGTPGGGDPVDCDYPFCGCDPSAEKVITALIECGWSKPVSTSQSCLGCGSIGDPWIKHEPSGVYLCSRCTVFVRDGMNKAHAPVEGAGPWEAAAREAAKEIKTSPTGHMTCRLSEGHIFDIILKHATGLASPPEGTCIKCHQSKSHHFAGEECDTFQGGTFAPEGQI